LDNTELLAMKKLRAIDLFSGCGGLSLGLRQSHFQVVGAIEIDPLAVKTYKANHPGVEVWQNDIRKVAVSRVMKKLRLQPGQLDLLAGCPPCQGFSRLTTLNGKVGSEDSRNDLVFQFLRFVRVMKPKAIMMENVPGLAKDRRIDEMCTTLRSLGYECEVRIVDAADYGVPQRRLRMILLAGRSGRIPFARKGRRKRTVRETFRKLGKRARKTDELHNLPESRSASVSALIRLIPKNGGSRRDLGMKSQLKCHKRCDGFSDVYGRMRWNGVSPTITGGCCNPSKGRFIHPAANRTISLREAALLQSFPLSYKFSLDRGKFAVAQMIGNALPPELIKRQAKRIDKYLRALGESRGLVGAVSTGRS
jgi:DNA (cytosine-5)-methyltransferase 1